VESRSEIALNAGKPRRVRQFDDKAHPARVASSDNIPFAIANMLTPNRLAKNLGFALLAVTLGGAALEARTRKGDRLLGDSRAAELRKDWDKAISLAEQALSEDPADIAYQLTASRLRFYAAQFHIDQGLKLRDQGQLEQALTEFQKGYGINPASAMAAEEIARTKQMMERAKQQPALKPEERALTPAQAERLREEKKFAAMEPLPGLKPLNPDPIYLKMNNQSPKVLFETVGKYAGVNVLFDPDYSSTGPQKPQSIELNNSTLGEALDYIALITKSFWKPISPNTIFVTQDNPTTRRNFEDWVVKVFYLQNVLSTQELTEIIAAIRSAVDLQKVFPYSAQNAIIVRGEADKVALAEKIVADLDKPRGEVLVEVIVMTVNSTKERDLAAAFAPNGINSPISFNPRSGIATQTSTPSTTGTPGTSTPSTSTTIPLSNIARLSTRDFSLTVPGGLLNALLTDNNTKVLQHPQVRAVDHQKVSMKIGDRVPYATGSFQPGIGGVGINPLVNTQFTFLDTGVNVDITPYVHGPDEVSLHVDVEISNVTGSVPLGGINEPEVAQTKISNDVRLRQGEVNLMGGLMQVEEDKTVSGVPGLGNIPVLRRLFTSETLTKKASELVIVLIPHIIRSPDITDVNLREVASGNATNVKVNYAPQKPAEPPAATPAQPPVGSPPAAPPATPSATQAPAASPTVVSPIVAAPGRPEPGGPVPPIPGITIPPIGAPNSTPAPAAPPATAPAVPPAKPTAEAQRSAEKPNVKFVPAQASAELNGTVTVSLMVENAVDLASTPMQIRFDPKILHLNDVARGNLLASDGQQVAFSKNILNDTGEATVNVSRFPTTGGVTGSGSIVTLVFQAVGRGDAVVTVPSLTLRNSQSQAILTANPQLAVRVK
jgi:general secretion pathway protein D